MIKIFEEDNLRKCGTCGMIFNLDKESRTGTWKDDFCCSYCAAAYLDDKEAFLKTQKEA